MKDDLSAIFWNFNEFDKAVLEAQRMQELRDLMEYRKRHLRQIIDWSDPIKRAKMQYHYVVEETEGRKKLKDIPAEKVMVRTGASLKQRELPTFIKRLTWFQRFMRWMKRLF